LNTSQPSIFRASVFPWPFSLMNSVSYRVVDFRRLVLPSTGFSSGWHGKPFSAKRSFRSILSEQPSINEQNQHCFQHLELRHNLALAMFHFATIVALCVLLPENLAVHWPN
jgi:hypothetical protein